MDERELPTNRIHDYVTWPTTSNIFEDGRGGLSFPEQNNSNCRVDEDGQLLSAEGKPVTVSVSAGINYVTDSSDISVDNIAYIPTYSVNVKPEWINCKVVSFQYDAGRGTLLLDCPIPTSLSAVIDISTPAKFSATTPDTLECTNIVSVDIFVESIIGNVVTFTSSISDIPYDWTRNIVFELELKLNTARPVYIYLTKQANQSDNGVYCYLDTHVSKVSAAPIDEVEDAEGIAALNDSSVNDNVPCCDHFRKTYSHREVYDRINKSVGKITDFGVKSFSISGCDGGFIDWFTSSGSVNIGNGHDSVFVDGFGLGEFYNSNSSTPSTKVSLPTDAFDENDGTLHPWLEWAYGTRYDAQTSTNVSALPRDWPFTHLNETDDNKVFNKLTDTSNITLVKSCESELGSLGNLERDVEEEEIDPDSGETVTNTYHVFNNKHHIVLYPDYRPITNKDGYVSGSVVVKPLFIHLPASLDTKDGECIDITLSIQNVDAEAFGGGTDNAVKSLSGYYAAMSQPRVYVMGGVQKFSNKKIPFSSVAQGESEYTITSNYGKSAYKNDGISLLDDDTEVRASIVVMQSNSIGARRTFVAHGKIVGHNSDGSVTIKFNGKFPYPTIGPDANKMSYTICGMAYLDDKDNPSNTKMGLYTRDLTDDNGVNLYRDDMGNGDTGTLNEFNKFYSIGSVDSRTSLPLIDKRYLLATVYQTSTNTFPWDVAHRRKLATLANSWTDDIERVSSGNTHISIMQMIYNENLKLFNYADDSSNPARILINNMPVTYRTDYEPWISLASRLRCSFPSHYTELPNTSDNGNPVRVARYVTKMFASDFSKMRLLSEHGNKKARVKITKLCIDMGSTWPMPNGQLIPSGTDYVEPSTATEDIELLSSIWCSKLRNLPKYIRTMPYFGVSDADTDKWTKYIDSGNFLYGSYCNTDESSSATETMPYGNSFDGCEVFNDNSIVTLFGKKLSHNTMNNATVDNIKRYSETVLGVKVAENAYMDLHNIGGTTLQQYRYTSYDFRTNTYVPVLKDAIAPRDLSTDWMNPFTNIQSIDSVPYPSITMEGLMRILAGQQEFASADVAQMYRYEYNDTNDNIQYVSEVMPTESELAKMLESYVVARSSEMPLHMYSGTRVLLKNGVFPGTDDPIYIRAIDRVKKRMVGDESLVARYINDCFGVTNAETRDPNVDYAKADYPSIGVSASPYVTPQLAKNETYTRVIMQFTFSQKAGRWYTTGYRQYPTNYLSPLYGSDALGAKLPSLYTESGGIAVQYDKTTSTFSNDVERYVWRQPCEQVNSYRSQMYLPYSSILPMDITLGCVPYLVNDGCVFDFENDGAIKPQYADSNDNAGVRPLSKLEEPFKPINRGGLNLYPPANANGGYSEKTDDGVHANFWSVREYVRPAVSVLPGTDVPGHDELTEIDGNLVPNDSRVGGVLSDATLYRMFDFPKAGQITYKLPSETDPDDDKSESYLLYAENGKTGIIIPSSSGYAIGYGISEREQDIT